MFIYFIPITVVGVISSAITSIVYAQNYQEYNKMHDIYKIESKIQKDIIFDDLNFNKTLNKYNTSKKEENISFINSQLNKIFKEGESEIPGCQTNIVNFESSTCVSKYLYSFENNQWEKFKDEYFVYPNLNISVFETARYLSLIGSLDFIKAEKNSLITSLAFLGISSVAFLVIGALYLYASFGLKKDFIIDGFKMDKIEKKE